ncbi:MAG: tetratricopeptide repeat protein [Blastocatellia bacterium]|nr:tetratricopeptide repeat protein [Blastocatellia bacterium]
MKLTKIAIPLVFTIGLLVVFGFVLRGALHRRAADLEVKSPDLSVAKGPSTPADARIQTAQQAIAQSPNKPEGYNLLASAFMQKARETGDFGFNARAEGALVRSLEVDPENYDAIKLRAKLLLTYHRFGEALQFARRAQALRPDDHDNYGALTDALVELGDYPAAIEAAQKMVDLRPDSASYARVSYLRSLHGDGEGAIEAMRVAVKAANPNDPEGAAWCRVHLGDELMNTGKRREADQEYDNALYLFPDYPLALAAKARARVAAGDLPQAINFYERAQNRVPLPETAIALGDLYARLRRPDDAKRQYQLVEFVERNSAASGTYSRQLAMFWADHDEKLDQALAIAQKERSTREDIYTCDALAWTLFKNNRLDEAQKSMAEALRLGTRDARLYYHAGMISNELGERQNATRYLTLALETNPNFDVLQVELARKSLDALKNGRGRKSDSSASVAVMSRVE